MIQTVLSGTGTSSARWIDVLEPTSEELGSIAEEYGIPRAALDEGTVPLHLPKHERLGGTTFVIARVYDEESRTQGARRGVKRVSSCAMRPRAEGACGKHERLS